MTYLKRRRGKLPAARYYCHCKLQELDAGCWRKHTYCRGLALWKMDALQECVLEKPGVF